MTYSEMKSWFLILQDKYGSPYYTDSEIAAFLNRAQIDETVALLPMDGGKLNVELNANTIARIEPLLVKIPSPVMPGASGDILKADVNAVLTTPVLRVLGVAYNNKPVRDTRYNNLFTYINNIFKVPSADSPRMYESASTWYFIPIDITANIIFMAVRHPVTLVANGSVNCELPELMHNDVVARALSYAGVGSRDQMLSELKQLNQV